ncbi:FUSC family protein [Paraburkholderia unamae]|uniref:FUSC family protein n=1 Tax=Paraburkholderia unamae TaxID=219649 RepID=A0ACC6RBG0_9BURK
MKTGRLSISIPDHVDFKKLPPLSIPGVTWEGLAYAVRTAGASLIALYIAFCMNLDDPKWAAITVWVVAQNSRGMSVSKSQYRILGTALGAVAALVLVALFAQTPELFLLGLAGWIGLCTGLATALRNFRAYAAVLAGYTAAIIGLDAASAPLHAFDIALARFVYVVVGILVEATLTAILAPGAPLREVREQFHGYVSKASQFGARALRRETDEVAIHKLFAAALELDTAAEYAAAASAEVRLAVGHLRAAIVAVLTQLSAIHALRAQLTRHPDLQIDVVDETATLLAGDDTDSSSAKSRIASLKSRIKHALASEEYGQRGSQSGRLFILDRLTLLLTAREQVIARKSCLDQVNPPRSLVKFAFHHDHVLAWHNGMRAFFAVVAASMFWLFSAWPSGAGFVATVGVVSALFATRPNSIVAAMGWFKGAFIAALAGILCNFVLLPAVTDFVPLVCIAGFFTISAGLAMRNPRTASIGSGFALFFWNFTSPSNVARINDAAFLNDALSTLLAIAWATLAFSVLFPADRASSIARLQRAVRRDLSSLASNPQRWRRDAWLSCTADRLGRRFATEASSAKSGSGAQTGLRELLAAWTIGDSVLALQQGASSHPGLRRSMTVIQGRLRTLDFARLATVCDALAARLLRQASIPADRASPDLLDGAALLQTIAVSAKEYMDATRGYADPA